MLYGANQTKAQSNYFYNRAHVFELCWSDQYGPIDQSSVPIIQDSTANQIRLNGVQTENCALHSQFQNTTKSALPPDQQNRQHCDLAGSNLSLHGIKLNPLLKRLKDQTAKPPLFLLNDKSKALSHPLAF